MLEGQGLFVPFGLATLHVLPGGGVAEARVVTESFALAGLELLAEVPPAGLLSLQGIETQQLGQLQEIGHAASLLQLLIEIGRVAGDVQAVRSFVDGVVHRGRYDEAALLEALAR